MLEIVGWRSARPEDQEKVWTGQEGDELVQANVTKEMAFEEGWEVGNMGPKKLILIMRVQPNSA